MSKPNSALFLSRQSPKFSAILEVRLLVDFLRNKTGNKNYNFWINRLSSEDIDWNLLLELAQYHRVSPLLYRKIKDIDNLKIPTFFIDDLKKIAHVNSIRNKLAIHELFAVTDILSNNGISSLTFKGPSLSVLAFNDFSIRAFSDLDILVHSYDFLRAREILLRSGYEADVLSYFVNSEEEEKRLISKLGECTLICRKSQTYLDLHERLDAGGFFRLSHDFDDVWDNIVEVNLFDRQLNSLSLEDLIIYLCIHGAKSLWNSLNLIVDLSELVNKNEIDWDIVLHRSTVTNSQQMLFLGLMLTQKIIGTPLPIHIESIANKNFKCNDLLGEVMTNLQYKSLPNLAPQVDILDEFIFHFRVLQSFKDRWNCLLTFYRRLTQPKKYYLRKLRLPRKAYILYYIVGPIRFLFKLLFRI